MRYLGAVRRHLSADGERQRNNVFQKLKEIVKKNPGPKDIKGGEGAGPARVRLVGVVILNCLDVKDPIMLLPRAQMTEGHCEVIKTRHVIVKIKNTSSECPACI